MTKKGTISPYSYPGLDMNNINLIKYPFLNNVVKLNKEGVLDMVCEHYKICHNDLIGKLRKRVLVEPRMVLSFILKRKYDLSLREIGEMIGGRDHSSIFHYIETFEGLHNTSKNFRERSRKILLACGVDCDKL